ncbi:hypothetical protein [Tepidibacillus fermentans]|uniref:Uncharacterized protein n=1 Tax=Tepidibacillus fermentans TaxID=1281767 RepID=A0A4R3K914_9BACI|nr:hypothetical protein [Tepidibacillus fermentans]TCS79388.1 hypothetical protein EDD72_12113 [Tepidibacillus fermentans]
MEYLCPLCEKKLTKIEEGCEKLHQWFAELKGKTLWRIRYLNKYEYIFLSEDDFQRLQQQGAMILDETTHWEQFDPDNFSGITTSGDRVSIFEE